MVEVRPLVILLSFTRGVHPMSSRMLPATRLSIAVGASRSRQINWLETVEAPSARGNNGDARITLPGDGEVHSLDSECHGERLKDRELDVVVEAADAVQASSVADRLEAGHPRKAPVHGVTAELHVSCASERGIPRCGSKAGCLL